MGKTIDLTNQKFGRLTVIKRVENDNWNRAIWLCKCDCGTEVRVASVNLRKGHTKSCGCLAKEMSSKRNQKNLIGQKFGKLTVLKDSGRRDPNSGSIYWTCQCECGSLVEVRGSHLIAGNISSCQHCSHLIDMKGLKQGLLTVLDYDKNKKKWRCSCECGNITFISRDSLLQGTQSCGCIKSKGELKINQILQQNNIQFETQKTFETCRFPDTNALARFDFYLPDYNLLIEYDGEQHFKEGSGHFNNPAKFQKTQEHDGYKNQWCENNNISLIRIPYTYYNNITIEDLLLTTSKFLV